MRPSACLCSFYVSVWTLGSCAVLQKPSSNSSTVCCSNADQWTAKEKRASAFHFVCYNFILFCSWLTEQQQHKLEQPTDRSHHIHWKLPPTDSRRSLQVDGLSIAPCQCTAKGEPYSTHYSHFDVS